MRPGVHDGTAFVAGELVGGAAKFIRRHATDRLGERRLVGHAHPQERRDVHRMRPERQHDRGQDACDAADRGRQRTARFFGDGLQFWTEGFPEFAFDREHVKMGFPIVDLDALHGADEVRNTAFGRMETAFGVLVEISGGIDIERRQPGDLQSQIVNVRQAQRGPCRV